MKVLLFMTQTANGMIARKNYQEDFLSNENWNCFVRLAEKIGCFIIGRKTADKVKKWKEYNFNNIKARKIIVSRKKSVSKNRKSKSITEIIASSPQEALQQAGKLGFKQVLLTGGGILNSAFMKHNLVDEITINIEPFILGRGIGIFADTNFEKRLKLTKVTKLKRGIIQLNYRIK